MSNSPPPPIPVVVTNFGFNWGAATVTRVTELPKGNIVIRVETNVGAINIRVTKCGKIVVTNDVCAEATFMVPNEGGCLNALPGNNPQFKGNCPHGVLQRQQAPASPAPGAFVRLHKTNLQGKGNSAYNPPIPTHYPSEYTRWTPSNLQPLA